MIYSQIFVLLNFIGYILQLCIKFDLKYLNFISLPWDIILSISTISLMNEFRKYIVIFDFVGFLGFRKQFSSRFKKFTNIITSLTNLIYIFIMILVFIRNLLGIITLLYTNYNDYYLLFDQLVFMSATIRIILV